MKIANEHSHRFARQITQQTPALAELVGELISAIEGISDEDILKAFEQSVHDHSQIVECYSMSGA